MDKPIMLKAEEFREIIIQSINNSGLHIMIVKYIIDNIKNIVDEEYRKVLEKEIKEYNNDNTIKQEVIPNGQVKEN